MPELFGPRNTILSSADTPIKCRVNKKTLELLQSYPWPGNIRELQNVIERSLILCETEIFSIDESWLPKQPSLTEPKNQMELPRSLLAQEKEMIEAAPKESRAGYSDPRGLRPSWASRGPRWNRRSGRRKSTRIASGLLRKREGSRPICCGKRGI